MKNALKNLINAGYSVVPQDKGMKEITLKEACEILDKAEAVLVENREDIFSAKLQEVGLFDPFIHPYIENAEPCPEENGGDCDCEAFPFLLIGSQNDDDEYDTFPSSHNLKVKITPDGSMLINSALDIPTKIKILTAKDLNAI